MALAYGNGFISNGLVHLVDASNMKSFPGAGTTWSDLSGNNRNGTLNNGLLWGAGNGGAISFDGSNDYVSFPNDIYSTLTTTTFSVWFYLNGTSTWQRVYDFGRGQTLNIFFTPNSGAGVPRFVINIGGGEQQLNDTTSATTGVWYNFVVTLNGSQAQMYRNGTLVATNTSFTYTPSSLGSTTQTWFGRSQYPDPYLNGKIAQFAAYNRVLNSTEIQQNYNYLINRFQSTSVFSPTQISGLQLWLDADDSRTLYSDTSGTTKATTDGTAVALWVDKSGNGNNVSQSTASARPAIKSSFINGRNVLNFDGSNDTLTAPSSTATFKFLHSTGSTVFIVVQYKATGTYRSYFTTATSSSNVGYIIYSPSDNTTYLPWIAGGVGGSLVVANISAADYIDATKAYLVCAASDPTNATAANRATGFKNGGAPYKNNTQTLAASSANSTYDLAIGSEGGAYYANVYIAEILAYNSLLTASQRIQVETYLNNKWGLWSSFNPTSISGLQLWLDSSDSGTLFQDSAGIIPAINDGDPVGYWKDKSGNSKNATQSTAANRPTLKTSIQNSKNILRFDGSNDGLAGSDTGFSTTTSTVFIVCKSAIAGNDNYPIMFGTDASTQLVGLTTYNNQMQITQYGASTYVAFTTNAWNLVYFTKSSNSWTMNLNGTSASTTMTTSTVLSGNYGVGFNKSGNRAFFNGDIAEILIYNSVLSTAQLQQVQTYLNQKWGAF